MNDQGAAAAFTIRDSTEADLAAIAAIYAHHVRAGFGSFEEVPPEVAELARRRSEVLARDLPYLVASDGGAAILGYAYASPYRTRSAYRFTVEDSIYVAAGAERRGIGLALLAGLIERCTAAGYRQMVAVIGDSANASSIGLHARLGFRPVGILSAIGFKHGRWVDSVLMQRELGAGDTNLPAADPHRS
jgi:L-amino acid N-acyltransferase YncA